ncbi:MAG: glycosyltransferase [Acidobacteria bacterium]|nr:glycosyltransferase [Acidobacteriota bacterium]
MTPLVSVVVPNHNCERFLAAALDSVLGQSYTNREIIVVDDGSTDESLEILKRYVDRAGPARLQVVTQANQGVSAARNAGIARSRGELVAFLDADDLWHPDKLAKQVPLFANPAVGLVYCAVEYVDERLRPLGTNFTGRRGRVLREIAMLRGTVVLAGGSTAVVRRECFDKAGRFDPEMSTAADWDMWRRIACYWEVDVVREPLMQYRMRPASMHRNVKVFEHDMLHGFAQMFADPAAGEVQPLRRRAYANLYLMLSGSHLEAGNTGQAIAYAFRSIAASPASLAYIAALPWRRLRRAFGASEAHLADTALKFEV